MFRENPRVTDGWCFVILRGRGPTYRFQARGRRPERRNWLHLDLYTNDRDGEVKRLVQLRARRYPWRYRPHADFVVLEDPGGTLFCVVQTSQLP